MMRSQTCCNALTSLVLPPAEPMAGVTMSGCDEVDRGNDIPISYRKIVLVGDGN